MYYADLICYLYFYITFSSSFFFFLVFACFFSCFFGQIDSEFFFIPLLCFLRKKIGLAELAKTEWRWPDLAGKMRYRMERKGNNLNQYSHSLKHEQRKEKKKSFLRNIRRSEPRKKKKSIPQHSNCDAYHSISRVPYPCLPALFRIFLWWNPYYNQSFTPKKHVIFP